MHVLTGLCEGNINQSIMQCATWANRNIFKLWMVQPEFSYWTCKRTNTSHRVVHSASKWDDVAVRQYYCPAQTFKLSFEHNRVCFILTSSTLFAANLSKEGKHVKEAFSAENSKDRKQNSALYYHVYLWKTLHITWMWMEQAFTSNWKTSPWLKNYVHFMSDSLETFLMDHSMV